MNSTAIFYFAVRKVDELQDGQNLCLYVAEDSTISPHIDTASDHFWRRVQNQTSFHDGTKTYSLPQSLFDAERGKNLVFAVYATCIVEVVNDYLCVAICNVMFNKRVHMVTSILHKVYNHCELHSRNSYTLDTDTLNCRLRVWCLLEYEDFIERGLPNDFKGPPHDERTMLLKTEAVGKRLDEHERMRRARWWCCFPILRALGRW